MGTRDTTREDDGKGEEVWGPRFYSFYDTVDSVSSCLVGPELQVLRSKGLDGLVTGTFYTFVDSRYRVPDSHTKSPFHPSCRLTVHTAVFQDRRRTLFGKIHRSKTPRETCRVEGLPDGMSQSLVYSPGHWVLGRDWTGSPENGID